MEKYLERFLQQPIAILGPRYWYRGILTHIGIGFVVLSDGHMVQLTGAMDGAEPKKEEAIVSDIVIFLGGIEIVFQPLWAFHGYNKEKEK